MKNQNAVFAIASFLSLFSSVAFADSSSSESDLSKAIQDNVEKIHAADAKKFDRLLMLAGNQRNELSAKKDDITKTYNEWREVKSAALLFKNGDTAKYKAIEAAAEKYAQASKAFMNIQSDILAKNDAMSDGALLAEAINTLNATAPTAAGH